MTDNEKTGFSFDDIEDASLPRTGTSGASASATDTHNESLEDEPGSESNDNDGDEDLRETGVHENAVDALLTDTGKPGADIDDLNESETFTLQVIGQLESAVARGEVLLKDTELAMEERISKIRETITEIGQHLLIDAIIESDKYSVAAKAMLTALSSRLDHSLLRQLTKNASPSSLPVKVQDLSEGEVDALATQLAAFTAVTDEGKREAARMHAIVAADKARRTATGPTIAVSITPPPPPPAEERQPLIVPPASAVPDAETAWQSGPEAVRPANEVVTQDAPLETPASAVVAPASPAPSEEPSVRVSPSMENEMVKQPNPQPPVETQVPPVLEHKAPHNSMPNQVRTRIRVGRHVDNDWVINNPTVSTHHATLTMNEGSIKVEDLGSSNGTFVASPLNEWVKVEQGKPVTVQVGQRIKFGSVEVTTSHDANKLTHFHFLESGKLSPSQMFFLDGEQLSELHRLEQERLNAEDAAKHPQPPKVEEPKPKLKSPTEMQQSIAKSSSSGNGLGKALGVGMLIIGALALLTLLFVWGMDGFNRRNTVATTETETSTESETSTSTETVAETETSTPIVTETETEVVTETETSTGYSCRPGSSVTSCNRVEDFLLARADGEAYWDCSGMDPDAFRDIYSIDDPSSPNRHVIANTCACQLCEPTTATP